MGCKFFSANSFQQISFQDAFEVLRVAFLTGNFFLYNRGPRFHIVVLRMPFFSSANLLFPISIWTIFPAPYFPLFQMEFLFPFFPLLFPFSIWTFFSTLFQFFFTYFSSLTSILHHVLRNDFSQLLFGQFPFFS